MTCPLPMIPLTVAISSRALFDLEESHAVFCAEGVEAYAKWQIAREEEPLAPGPAFPLVRKLLALNRLDPPVTRVEVILLSRNSADSGLRVFNAIRHHGLAITRAVFTTGGSLWQYAAAFQAHLFLSLDPEDARLATLAGLAAAVILPSGGAAAMEGTPPPLRIAFDGDAVLFSDASERIYQEQGLAAFQEHEQRAAREPLPEGPFKPLLEAIQRIQRLQPEQCPIRTALVTSRGAPAHERVIRTLRAWNIRVDELLFLGGMDKGPFLAAFGADIFFDDHTGHCESVRRFVPAGQVPRLVKSHVAPGES
ncbi:MAG: 5'-nucleotidase [Magnetococcales bacterium]|nr:5'-nucleotidase [Magnetococcales bacterium]